MSLSRNSQKNKKSKENVLADSSEESANSPAVKLKNSETKTNPDPLYYHPAAHPTPSTFFRQKSRELEKEMRSSGELTVKEDVTTENVAVKKAGM